MVNGNRFLTNLISHSLKQVFMESFIIIKGVYRNYCKFIGVNEYVHLHAKFNAMYH
jgi:hypothetical protein